MYISFEQINEFLILSYLGSQQQEVQATLGLSESLTITFLPILSRSEGNGKDNASFVQCVCSVERVKGEKSSLKRETSSTMAIFQ